MHAIMMNQSDIPPRPTAFCRNCPGYDRNCPFLSINWSVLGNYISRSSSLMESKRKKRRGYINMLQALFTVDWELQTAIAGTLKVSGVRKNGWIECFKLPVQLKGDGVTRKLVILESGDYYKVLQKLTDRVQVYKKIPVIKNRISHLLFSFLK